MATKKVVVVDDDPVATSLVSRILEKKGYQTLAVHDGRHGIEAIMSLEPDLIVLDVRMPILHGYDVCRYVKSRWELKKTKVLMFSGLALGSDLKWAAMSGADDYMTKPFEDWELLEKVEKLLKIEDDDEK